MVPLLRVPGISLMVAVEYVTPVTSILYNLYVLQVHYLNQSTRYP